MDEQRYPLVVWTPPQNWLALGGNAGATLPAADHATPAAAGGDCLPAAETPAGLCATCPWPRERLELRQQAGYWKALFERCKQRQAALQQQLAELQQANWPQRYQQSQEQVGCLQQQLAELQAKLHVLEKQLRGRKSEKGQASAPSNRPANARRRRGRQPNQPTPPRRCFDHLPTRPEDCCLPPEQQRCRHCGQPYAPFPGTDDGDILEIDVQAHRRRYHRQRYRKTCACPGTPAVVTAPPPAKLIPKGYLGISIWVLLLLEKYAAYQPLYRCLAVLRSFDLDLPQGTITDGLQQLLPLFAPIYQALGEHQRQEGHWYIDETRWLVFITQAGKSGYNWNLWVFCSADAVVFVLDPHRAHDVSENYLSGARGIANVDRASNHKAMAQVKAGDIVLAFCWAHVRRDFLELLTGYTELSAWAVSWLADIRELYARTEARLEYYEPPPVAPSAPPALVLEPPPTAVPSVAAAALVLEPPPAAVPSELPAALVLEPPPTAVPSELPAAAVVLEPPPAAVNAPPPTAAPDGPSASGPTPAPARAPTRLSAAQAFAAHDQRLRQQVQDMAQRRDRELQQSDLHPACRKVLTSLQNHWSGLTVFLEHPHVPLDNNTAERAERGPVVARKNYYGSGALWSGRLAAMLFSLCHTLSLWDLCPRRWLTAYLTACAEAGGQVPAQPEAFLPWNLSPAQRQEWSLPCSRTPAAPAPDSS